MQHKTKMPFASKLGNDLMKIRVILSDGNSKELQNDFCAIWLPNSPQARKKTIEGKNLNSKRTNYLKQLFYRYNLYLSGFYFPCIIEHFIRVVLKINKTLTSAIYSLMFLFICNKEYEIGTFWNNLEKKALRYAHMDFVLHNLTWLGRQLSCSSEKSASDEISEEAKFNRHLTRVFFFVLLSTI